MNDAPAPAKWRRLFMAFIEKLRIQSREGTAGIEGGGIPMTLWGSQQRFLDNVAEGLDQGVHKFVCLKSRQLGVTTLSLAIDLFWLAMHPGINGALVVHNGAAKESFRLMLQQYIASFPPKYFGTNFAIKKGQNNKDFIGFTNGSRLNFIVAGEKDVEKETFGDGAGYSLVHLTECALYASVKALNSFEQTFSETNPNRLYIYESRANGMNHWRDSWISAGRDVYTTRRFFIGWWARADQAISRKDRRFAAFGLHPPSGEEHELMNHVLQLYRHRITPEQLAWYRWKASDDKMSMESMHAQQPWTEEQAFVAGGFSFFANRRIGLEMDEAKDPAVGAYRAYRYIIGNDFFSTFLEEIDANTPEEMRQLRVWERPIKGAQYVIGMDPAYGSNDNKDRTVISVWRCFSDALVIVAEFADHVMTAGQAAWVLCHLAGNYEDCIINLEIQGPGRLVMQSLEQVRNLLTQEQYEDRVRERNLDEFLQAARWYLYRRPDMMGAGYVYNFQTNGSTKYPLMDQMKTAHNSGELFIRSMPLLQEMTAVRQNGMVVEAPGRNKDDRVIAAALAIEAWKRWRQAGLIGMGYTYDSQMRAEAGEPQTMGDVMNAFVQNYLKTMEAADAEGPQAPAWMRERGLA